MIIRKKTLQNKGQTLVSWLVVSVVFIIIVSASVTMVMVNSVGSDKFQQAINTREMAESGIENGLLRLLRDPNYSGETISIDDGSAVVTVTGDALNKTILSVGTYGNFQRKIQAQITYNDNILIITSWQEIP